MTDEIMTELQNIGIDPVTDIEIQGNYRWRYRAKHKFSVKGYACPAGSAVDISRTITIIVAPKETPCSDDNGQGVGFIKLLPDGSAEPLGRENR